MLYNIMQFQRDENQGIAMLYVVPHHSQISGVNTEYLIGSFHINIRPSGKFGQLHHHRFSIIPCSKLSKIRETFFCELHSIRRNLT